MKKEYILELISLHSDQKSNIKLNHFLSEKQRMLNFYLNCKKYFNYSLLSIYLINLFYFTFLFLNNLYFNEKLDYIEGVYCFIAFICLLFVFVLNDFFNYIIKKYINKKYKKVKDNYLNSEVEKSLFESFQLEDHILFLTLIENKLQEIQDEKPILLKQIYNEYKFKNEDTKKYVYFLISQEDFNESN